MSKPTDPYKQNHVLLGVYITPEQKQRLKEKAAKQEISLSHWVRKQLRRHWES